MSYTAEERGRYEPPACPGCCRRHHVDWVETTRNCDKERTFLPGRTYCTTPDCAHNADFEVKP